MSEIEKAIETIKQVSDLDTKLHLNISNYDLLKYSGSIVKTKKEADFNEPDILR